MAELIQEEAINEYRGTISRGLMLAERSEKEGGFGEYFSGKLAVEDKNRRAMTAIMLENTASWLKSLDEATRAVQVGGFVDYLFPLIRASFTNNPAHDLVSVQPMTRKVGLIFFLNYVIGQTKGNNYVKGQRIYDTQTGYQGGSNYSDETVSDEDQGASAPSTGSATVSGQLSYLPLRRNTIVITIADTTVLVVRDDGNGGIVKVSGVPNVSSGSINYETGTWSVTFSTVLGFDKAITATYEYESEASSNLPQIDIQLTSSAIQAKRRALRLRYSQDSAYDFKQEFGIDADATLMAGIADLIRTEQAREIITDLWRSAGAPVASFNVTTTPAEYSRIEHYKDVIYTLNLASEAIYTSTQRVHGNWIVCDSKAAAMIASIPAPIFEAAPIDNTTQGVQFMGTLNGQYRVWKDKLLASEGGAVANGNMLMGYKGNEFWDAGYIWSPYQLLYTTTAITLDDFMTRRGLGTRYAKKIINPNLYKKISLV